MKLYDYQQEDVDKLVKIPGVALFDEQRTGKTPKALKLAEAKGAERILIVCPNTMLYVWKQEFIRWLDKPCEIYIGTPTQRIQSLNNWTHGLVISYDMLKIVQRGDKKYGALHLLLGEQIDCIIADEAHRFRTHNTAVSKAMHKIARKCSHRIALTGTPVVNKQNDIFGILRFLYPVTFASYWKFIDTYFQTSIGRGLGHEYREIEGLNAIGKKAIPRILNQIGSNRKRKEVMPWLPEKDRTDILLPMTKNQARYLKELEEYYETEDVITQGTLDRLIRYRQICLAPELLNLDKHSPKVEWLKQYFIDYPDRPTLLFSKFTSFIHRYKGILPEHSAIITGETPASVRKKAVDDFQGGSCNVLLMNIDTCNEGITLDRAECCIFIDKFPPFGTIHQAEDRFIATTEARKDKPHIIYTLIMEGSYEEVIADMLEHGASEAEIINNFKDRGRNTNANH